MNQVLINSRAAAWLSFSLLLHQISGSRSLDQIGENQSRKAWCSQGQCEGCRTGTIPTCSNISFPSLRGDLCGCCPSCILVRELGESCGSQLSVRPIDIHALEVGIPSTSDVMILATSWCRPGLVCVRFTCRDLGANIEPAVIKNPEGVITPRNDVLEDVGNSRMKLSLDPGEDVLDVKDAISENVPADAASQVRRTFVTWGGPGDDFKDEDAAYNEEEDENAEELSGRDEDSIYRVLEEEEDSVEKRSRDQYSDRDPEEHAGLKKDFTSRRFYPEYQEDGLSNFNDRRHVFSKRKRYSTSSQVPEDVLTEETSEVIEENPSFDEPMNENKTSEKETEEMIMSEMLKKNVQNYRNLSGNNYTGQVDVNNSTGSFNSTSNYSENRDIESTSTLKAILPTITTAPRPIVLTTQMPRKEEFKQENLPRYHRVVTSVPGTKEIYPEGCYRRFKKLEYNLMDDNLGKTIYIRMDGNEYHLTYGKDILEELEILLRAIDKTNSDSPISENDVDLLHSLFRNQLEDNHHHHLLKKENFPGNFLHLGSLQGRNYTLIRETYLKILALPKDQSSTSTSNFLDMEREEPEEFPGNSPTLKNTITTIRWNDPNELTALSVLRNFMFSPPSKKPRTPSKMSRDKREANEEDLEENVEESTDESRNIQEILSSEGATLNQTSESPIKNEIKEPPTLKTQLKNESSDSEYPEKLENLSQEINLEDHTVDDWLKEATDSGKNIRITTMPKRMRTLMDLEDEVEDRRTSTESHTDGLDVFFQERNETSGHLEDLGSREKNASSKVTRSEDKFIQKSISNATVDRSDSRMTPSPKRTMTFANSKSTTSRSAVTSRNETNGMLNFYLNRSLVDLKSKLEKIESRLEGLDSKLGNMAECVDGLEENKKIPPLEKASKESPSAIGNSLFKVEMRNSTVPWRTRGRSLEGTPRIERRRLTEKDPEEDTKSDGQFFLASEMEAVKMRDANSGADEVGDDLQEAGSPYRPGRRPGNMVKDGVRSRSRPAGRKMDNSKSDENSAERRRPRRPGRVGDKNSNIKEIIDEESRENYEEDTKSDGQFFLASEMEAVKMRDANSGADEVGDDLQEAGSPYRPGRRPGNMVKDGVRSRSRPAGRKMDNSRSDENSAERRRPRRPGRVGDKNSNIKEIIDEESGENYEERLQGPRGNQRQGRRKRPVGQSRAFLDRVNSMVPEETSLIRRRRIRQRSSLPAEESEAAMEKAPKDRSLPRTWLPGELGSRPRSGQDKTRRNRRRPSIRTKIKERLRPDPRRSPLEPFPPLKDISSPNPITQPSKIVETQIPKPRPQQPRRRPTNTKQLGRNYVLRGNFSEEVPNFHPYSTGPNLGQGSKDAALQKTRGQLEDVLKDRNLGKEERVPSWRMFIADKDYSGDDFPESHGVSKSLMVPMEGKEVQGEDTRPVPSWQLAAPRFLDRVQGQGQNHEYRVPFLMTKADTKSHDFRLMGPLETNRGPSYPLIQRGPSPIVDHVEGGQNPFIDINKLIRPPRVLKLNPRTLERAGDYVNSDYEVELTEEPEEKEPEEDAEDEYTSYESRDFIFKPRRKNSRTHSSDSSEGNRQRQYLKSWFADTFGRDMDVNLIFRGRPGEFPESKVANVGKDRTRSGSSSSMPRRRNRVSSSGLIKREKSLRNNSKPRKRNTGGVRRPRRAVQMMDWLRAAQEYHDRLQEVRNAALKTWLASKEEFADNNVTNIKLFTREVPRYMQKYTPRTVLGEEKTTLKSPSQHTGIQDPSHLLFGILQNGSLSSDLTNLKLKNATTLEPGKKYTITTTGNSTIRIEEVNDEEDHEIRKVDFQGHQHVGGKPKEFQTPSTLVFATLDEDFDHMYESIDAEEGDFDYTDPRVKGGRFEDLEYIDGSNVEDVTAKSGVSDYAMIGGRNKRGVSRDFRSFDAGEEYMKNDIGAVEERISEEHSTKSLEEGETARNNDSNSSLGEANSSSTLNSTMKSDLYPASFSSGSKKFPQGKVGISSTLPTSGRKVGIIFEAEEDDEDPRSISKRETPLSLFRVNDKENRKVLVWPSNWGGYRHVLDQYLDDPSMKMKPLETTQKIILPHFEKRSESGKKQVEAVAEDSKSGSTGTKRIHTLDHRFRKGWRKHIWR